MKTTATRTIACPKCNGTGTVVAFLHVKDGFCFDCDGTGRITGTTTRRGKALSPLAPARPVGDAVLSDPTSVSLEDATAAFEIYEGTFPGTWNEADYARRNALSQFIGNAREADRAARLAARRAARAAA